MSNRRRVNICNQWLRYENIRNWAIVQRKNCCLLCLFVVVVVRTFIILSMSPHDMPFLPLHFETFRSVCSNISRLIPVNTLSLLKDWISLNNRSLVSGNISPWLLWLKYVTFRYFICIWPCRLYCKPKKIDLKSRVETASSSKVILSKLSRTSPSSSTLSLHQNRTIYTITLIP